MLLNAKIHKLNFKLFILFVGFNIYIVNIFTTEQINLFNSKISVNSDGTLDIQEDITVTAENITIKRGIEREFPTRYKDKHNNNIVVSWVIKQVLLDNRPIQYKLYGFANGKVLRIGDPNKLLSPGQHSFTIRYTTDRQLYFGDKITSLYFNINGTGWRLPIEKIVATVILPNNIPTNSITAEGYTGHQGQKGQDYKVIIEPNKNPPEVIFYTTRQFAPYENLTISITWPRGFISEPTELTKFWYLIRDNLYILWYFLTLLSLVAYYIYISRRLNKNMPDSLVIPLFYPPDNLSPAATRYISRLQYDDKAFAAEIVDMAVKGYLTIDYKKNFLWGGTYTLIKNKSHKAHVADNIDPKLVKILFEHNDKITLTQTDAQTIQYAINSLANSLSFSYAAQYFNFIMGYISTGIFISFISIIVPFIFLRVSNFTTVFVAIFLFIFINILFYFLLEKYKPVGRKIADKIAGFELFLKTTETERLKIIGTPPTKTPELYEKYLPYAIALNAEEQWSHQFVPIFNQLKNAGTPYHPIWIHGIAAPQFNSLAFSNDLNKSINSSVARTKIASSDDSPGSSSGSGGSGSSGGAGGGGGGGGW